MVRAVVGVAGAFDQVNEERRQGWSAGGGGEEPRGELAHLARSNRERGVETHINTHATKNTDTKSYEVP